MEIWNLIIKLWTRFWECIRKCTRINETQKSDAICEVIAFEKQDGMFMFRIFDIFI